MPNWCENRLRISGPEADLKKFQQQAIGHAPWMSAAEQQASQPSQLNFHSLLPVPAEVLNLGTGLEDWQVKHWGTKWEAAEVLLLDASATGLSYQFDTAWSPPIALFKAIGPQWPTLTFRLNYEELGCGFIGLCKVVGDNCVDECFNVNGP